MIFFFFMFLFFLFIWRGQYVYAVAIAALMVIVVLAAIQLSQYAKILRKSSKPSTNLCPELIVLLQPLPVFIFSCLFASIGLQDSV
jgi:hypothetical protein